MRTKRIYTIYTILFISLITNLCNNIYAQANGITATYTGTWQYDNGNQRFIVKIWQEGNYYKGHYKKVQLNNGTVTNTIYNSNKLYQNGGRLPFTISGKTGIQYGLSGLVYDNTIIGNAEDFQEGNLQMKMNQMVQGCQTCAVKSSWKVTSTGGMTVGTPPPFSVPLDIEITKVSNTITLD